MKKTREQLKILYLQIRKDHETREQEFAAVLRESRLRPDQFTIWNAFDDPDFDTSVIASHDALFMGGSSDDPADATTLDAEQYPFIKKAFPLIKRCRDESIPVFASCMGFLMILQVFDQEIIFDYDNIEMGFIPVYLTEAGKRDILFHDAESGFPTVSCHKKRAVSIPDGAELLAFSDACPIHVFKFIDKPFYAFQFHPEYSDDDLINIFARYADRYPGGQETLQHMIDTRLPTTLSNSLFGKFIDRVLLKP